MAASRNSGDYGTYGATRRAGNKTAQDDPCINPSGIYSGMTKRLAITDNRFSDVADMPKGNRKK